MRSTKSSLSSSVLVSRLLKTVGVVIILATLLDIGIAAIPYSLQRSPMANWVYDFTGRSRHCAYGRHCAVFNWVLDR